MANEATDADFLAGLDPEARTLFQAVEEAVHQDGDPSFRLDVGQGAATPGPAAAPATTTPAAAPAAPAATDQAAGQETKEAPLIPPAPAPAELPAAQKAYLERKARKEQDSRLAQENASLREAMAAIARGIEQRGQPQQPYDPQQEPAYNVDPELQAFLDDRDQRLMAGMQQMLGPVLQEKQQQQVLQQADVEQQQYKQSAVQFIQEVDGLEREYASSPEGNGYFERAGALDQKMTEFYGGLVRYGADPARVEQVVKAQMIGAYKVAEWLGVNPAIYVDYVAKNFGLNAGANGSPANGNGQPAPPTAARFPAAPSQQVQMAAAAQTNGLARSTPSATQVVDTNNPEFIVDQLASGQFSPQTLEGWAREGGDEAVIKNIMKVAAAAGRRG